MIQFKNKKLGIQYITDSWFKLRKIHNWDQLVSLNELDYSYFLVKHLGHENSITVRKFHKFMKQKFCQ